MDASRRDGMKVTNAPRQGEMPRRMREKDENGHAAFGGTPVSASGGPITTDIKERSQEWWEEKGVQIDNIYEMISNFVKVNNQHPLVPDMRPPWPTKRWRKCIMCPLDEPHAGQT